MTAHAAVSRHTWHMLEDLNEMSSAHLLDVASACRKNAESSRSHMLVGISLCKPPLDSSLRASQAGGSIMTRMATMWIGDLCGSEAFDLVRFACLRAVMC